MGGPCIMYLMLAGVYQNFAGASSIIVGPGCSAPVCNSHGGEGRHSS